MIYFINLSACTYAPKNTTVDNTYNARLMAIGVTEHSQDAMSSTIHEEETLGQGDFQETNLSDAFHGHQRSTSTPDFITIGSTKSDVARIQGTPKKIDDFSYINEQRWDYGNYNRITFKNGRVSEWNNSSGKLKVKMYSE
jgi:outer membrane protein assembly factor BamE (lipoprotein component of BamABCDE complex)